MNGAHKAIAGEQSGILLADAFTGMLHELNNYLNAIVLQAATLKLKVSADLHPSLDLIRQEGIQAGRMLRPLQQLRLEQRQASQMVDVAQVVGDALKSFPAGAVAFDRPAAPMEAAVPAAVLHRLVVYLLHCLLADEVRVRLGLERAGDAIRLTFQAAAPHALEGSWADFVQGNGQAESPADMGLWPFGIRSLLRLLPGQISIERPSEREMKVLLQWSPE